ncbi:MAG: hypothetical protein RHS_0137 [Robinsoniella sp. RHS]|nr:MAG: hypothetical protein RHS_0137 [Robinsoniella sp. RHS]
MYTAGSLQYCQNNTDSNDKHVASFPEHKALQQGVTEFFIYYERNV